MNTEKLQVMFGENTNTAELIIREGAAVKQLDPQAPLRTEITGVIGTPLEYLKKRVGTGQFEQERAHILINRENVELSLIINEHDYYTQGSVSGKLSFHPKFVEFGINTGKVWMPAELGMFFKMNRAFFSDRKENMELVTTLMNFTATVNHTVERSVKENGGRTDNFAQVVNSNLPASFTLNIPIFKGMQTEVLEVETFAQINGREVSFVLLSPGANQTLEDIRNKVIDEQIEAIKEVAPNIALIEV
ncbi:MAG: hypothetical protein PUG96_02540 [Prevotellaceae bacterium]|nr:hypothetical protein [Prevotellaceae bacterium]